MLGIDSKCDNSEFGFNFFPWDVKPVECQGKNSSLNLFTVKNDENIY